MIAIYGWRLLLPDGCCGLLWSGNVRLLPRGPAQPVNDQRYGNKHDDTQQHEQDISRIFGGAQGRWGNEARKDYEADTHKAHDRGEPHPEFSAWDLERAFFIRMAFAVNNTR